MDYKAFVNEEKTLLIAPAGYGKTHTIVECLKHTSGKQLILTHTHAGVAAIKEKIKKENISSHEYAIETISSFAQKYVHAFYVGVDIPEQDAKDKDNPDKDYHSFIVRKAITIFKCSIVKQVISSSYQGLFVDEYQDCTKQQHAMIMSLANILSTHILGDPLQGIFDFNGETVNFESDLSNFKKFPELEIPYRWYKNENNKGLGDLIKEFRESLKRREPIPINSNIGSSFYVIDISNSDFDDPKSNYRKKLTSLVQDNKNKQNSESLLIIVPEYDEFENGQRIRRGNIEERSKILTKIDFSKSLTLLEAIDDRSFYSSAKTIDEIIESLRRARKPIKKLKECISKFFYKNSPLRLKRNNVGLNDWISSSSKHNNGDFYIINKNGINKALSDGLIALFNSLISTPSKQNMYKLLLYLQNNLNLKKLPRSDLLLSIMKALHNSIHEDTTVYEAMKSYKNHMRRIGRKVNGMCIGTTLLTKGLEFDTVAILDAHKFDCPKHLYVALTRCCKKLIIFSEQSTLSPYSD
ncbi:UvrD-helicase domain-containing protein [Nitrosomonas communis]|uniref:DNA 3'-5' helicase II n=1 Tax=Nitrosomonas communis TaxID=44574 RepID=A0A1H2SQ55_9PROT|nr:UvrD-helicase domain-containing protein [Nitrosomonas communis]SDW33595.1 DNA helicase-2 / ATP-dependent DNA helicase PcrA [Nitrosomonas communis]